MKMTEAADHIGERVTRHWENRPAEHGVITGVGRKKTPLVYVRLDGRKWPVGIAPDLLELAS